MGPVKRSCICLISHTNVSFHQFHLHLATRVNSSSHLPYAKLKSLPSYQRLSTYSNVKSDFQSQLKKKLRTFLSVINTMDLQKYTALISKPHNPSNTVDRKLSQVELQFDNFNDIRNEKKGQASVSLGEENAEHRNESMVFIEKKSNNAIPTAVIPESANSFTSAIEGSTELLKTEQKSSLTNLMFYPQTILRKVLNKSLEERPQQLPSRQMSKRELEKLSKALAFKVNNAVSHSSRITRLELLREHLQKYPDTRGIIYKENVLGELLRLRQISTDVDITNLCRQILGLMGYVDPVKGRGIRILSIDGGGTRGLVGMEILKRLEIECNKPIHQLFDYACGVSTGSLIAALLMFWKMPITECERIYKTFSKQVFHQGWLSGASSLVRNQAFYNVQVFEKILQDNMHDLSMVDSMKDSPKFSAVSCVVNLRLLKNYLFRNYNLAPNVQSRYMGSCQYKVWEAIRASSAAPLYYTPIQLDQYQHADGGFLTNNPTGIAVHESQLLWPSTPIQCVVSLGNGRYEPPRWEELKSDFASYKNKLDKSIQSATDTEAVNAMMCDLLPPSTYFRFNPYMSEDFLLNEIRDEKWDQIQYEVQIYLRKNEHKMQRAAQQLMLPKRSHQKAKEWFSHWKQTLH